MNFHASRICKMPTVFFCYEIQRVKWNGEVTLMLIRCWYMNHVMIHQGRCFGVVLHNQKQFHRLPNIFSFLTMKSNLIDTHFSAIKADDYLGTERWARIWIMRNVMRIRPRVWTVSPTPTKFLNGITDIAMVTIFPLSDSPPLALIAIWHSNTHNIIDEIPCWIYSGSSFVRWSGRIGLSFLNTRLWVNCFFFPYPS